MAPTVHIAKKSFATQIDGTPVIVRKGITRVRAGHPLLKGREHLFAPAEDHADFDVVATATKAPGEKRRTRTKAATKTTAAKTKKTAKPAAKKTAAAKPQADES